MTKELLPVHGCRSACRRQHVQAGWRDVREAHFRREAAEARAPREENQHYADEQERAEFEAEQRWLNSGMGLVDYIRSRAEEGDSDFDLDWEIAREIAHDRAAGRFSAKRHAGRNETRFHVRSKREMNALAKSKVGEWVEGTSPDSVRNSIVGKLEDGAKNGDYRFKHPEDAKRIVENAVQFYKRFSRKTVMLSDGRVVYFAPDVRSKSERGISNDDAWAEYAIHAVTSSGRKLEGKPYHEHLFNRTKAASIWRIENVLKAEHCTSWRQRRQS